MEAKDRLVGELRIHSILADERNKLNRSIIRAMKQLRKEQDEISFKAGYEEGMKSQKTPRTDLECGLADEEFRKEFHIARKETDMEMYKAGIKEVVELCLEAIAAEPEFPSDMPDELWDELNGNRENTDLAMKNSVRLTKRSITERLQAQLKEWGIEESQLSSASPKE